jgi:hypothetical protein
MSQPPTPQERETRRTLRATLGHARELVGRSVSDAFGSLLFGLVVTTVVVTGHLQGLFLTGNSAAATFDLSTLVLLL